MLRNAGRSPLLLPLRIIRDEVVLIASRLIGRRNAGLETGWMAGRACASGAVVPIPERATQTAADGAEKDVPFS
jgi:hypothetical protein